MVDWAFAQEYEKRFWVDFLHNRGGLAYINNSLDYPHQHEYIPVLAMRIGVNLPEKRVVEVGCGPCGLSPWIKDAKERVAVEPLAQWFMGEGIDYHSLGYTSIHAKTVAEFAEMGGRYDVVICCNVLDHTDALSATLESLSQLGTPNAKMLLAYDHRIAPTDLHPTRVTTEDVMETMHCLGWTCIYGRTLNTEHEPDSVMCRRVEVWQKGQGDGDS